MFVLFRSVQQEYQLAGLFKVVVTSQYGSDIGNPFVNVYGYRSNLAVVNEEVELSNAWQAQVMPEQIKVQLNLMKIIRVEVYNVTNGIGYVDAHPTTGNTGLRTGSGMPSFIAWGFQYNRATAGKRNGAKRFGACSETDVDGDGPTSGMRVVLDAFAVKLGDPLQIGIIETWFPEILERKPAGVFPWTSHAISGVQFKRVTSQNSRKYGY
jgi:hypothetical protein